MKILFLLGLIFVISSCSVAPENSSIKKPYSAINKDTFAALEKLDNWRIHGRISIKTPKETSIISIRWQQSEDDIQIRLYGSMGKTYARLIKTKGLATLDVDHKTYTDSNPRFLLWSVLGWDLPIEEMRYWIKGITHPKHLEQSIIRNSKGQILSFKYKNWSAEYSQYKKFNHYNLPTKLILTHPQLRIRFSIQNWKEIE